MNTKAYQLSISLNDEELQDIAIAVLSTLDITAIEQQDDGLEIYDESVELLEQAKLALSDLPFIDESSLSVIEIENKNWNAEWERSFQPISVGSFCGVRASFHESLDVEHEIIINPELAFGTGHHETTYMMMDQMSRLDLSGARVFDYGCGTAILAILAKMLDSSYTLAIDYDPQSIKCAQDCLELNDVDNIDLRVGTIDTVEESHFDIILANINRNVLLEVSQKLYDRQAESGYLILSGLLQKDEQQITDLYESVGYQKLNVSYKGEWISILMRRG